MNTFDLQIQSTASDGKLSPRELVRLAKERGLLTIAITDHDTIDGGGEALATGAEEGIRVIPGIEISVEEHGAHILGYGFDYYNEALNAELKKSREGRIEGARQMVENLKKAGLVIEWEDVLKQVTGSTVARPHIARALLAHPENKEKLGKNATMHDLFETYLSDTGPYYVPRTHLAALRAIELIRSAGGVSIWSHPALHFPDNYDGLENFLQELTARGIEGVEVFNPSHTEDDTEFLNELAARHSLLRTAGSDFHYLGPHESDERGLHSANFPGDYETYGFPTDDILSRLEAKIQERKK